MAMNIDLHQQYIPYNTNT